MSDKKILSQQDIDNIRAGIENANPPLKRQDYKIIQLIGARVHGERAGHIVYFRQGARDGKHTPEGNNDTLTHQMKWLIENVKNVPHISEVELGCGKITFVFPSLQYNRTHIEFSLDGGTS